MFRKPGRHGVTVAWNREEEPKPEKKYHVFQCAPKYQPCEKCREAGMIRPAKRIARGMQAAAYECHVCHSHTVVSLKGRVYARPV